MNHRIFINYNPDNQADRVDWFEGYLKKEIGKKGNHWWSQDVTDYWGENTRCFYFMSATEKDKYKFYKTIFFKSIVSSSTFTI